MQTSLTFSNPGGPTPFQPAGGRDGGLLLIVDGHCYAYRAFFGISTLTSPSGRPTNAIYGFIRMLGKVRERARPSHTAVVWDDGLAPERMALLPEYKAQRAEMPAGLAQQLDGMTDYLRAAGIYSLRKEGCEADDCIAALTVQAAAAGLAVVIASSDKDFMQLVGGEVKLLVPQDKTEALWDGQQVMRKTGVEPGQIVDWLSLVGDASDNIPGVPGIGMKTAADLLGQFGSVDVLYEHLTEVKSVRLRASLEAAKERVRRNQQLVRLREGVPCGLELEDLSERGSNVEELRRLYRGWGFNHLLQGLEEKAAPQMEELFHERTLAG